MMYMQHVTQLSSTVEIILTLTAFGTACLKLWARFHRAVVAEHARTLRMFEAVRDVHGQDRAEVLRAYADLEAAIKSRNHSETLVPKQAPLPRLPGCCH
jgi:hypothetical protein